jgi:1,2-diacylglycerol 3-beta-glucosyltransferase
MASRLIAGGVLVASILVAWLAITSSLAARVLQAIIGISVVYVGYLAFRGLRFMRQAMAAAARDHVGPAEAPFVSLVVPARNEAVVIADVVRDLTGQRYGSDSEPAFEVVVIDDGSSDGTAELASLAATASAEVGERLRIVARDAAVSSTKGAALAACTPGLRGDVIGVVDADARVAPDFVASVVAAWQRDPQAAAIQARRQPRNARHSWLTRAQGEEQLMDLASQCGRRAVDGTAELRGNGMFVRRAALEAVGGWSPTAITEDLDLSTRLAAAGLHVALAPEVTVLEEAVESLEALWWQRLRWAEGSLRRLIELGPQLLAGSAPLGRKTDFLAFASEFVIPPVFAASVVASLLTVALPVRSDWTVPISLFAGYGLGSFLLGLAGLAGTGRRGLPLLGRSLRGALFLSHWLVVVPTALAWIAVGPATTRFRQTPRVGPRSAG